MIRNYSVGIALFAVLILSMASAYNTAEDDDVDWHSAYIGVRNLAGKNEVGNEHTFLSDRALSRIGAANALGIGGDFTFRVTDINASVFKAKSHGLYLKDAKGDNPATILEERELPTPSHFTGLPDYSYTIYDWANKNTQCPFTPPDHPEVCHEFVGWMGALNANHFGAQATATYRHYHALALDIAAKAEKQRQTIISNEGSDALPHYQEYLQEIEAEALIYEAVAQHYLQDRWAVGHMWDRWNGADLPNVAGAFWNDFLIGITTGLIHGAESKLRPVFHTLLSTPIVPISSFSSYPEAKLSLDLLNSPRVTSPTTFQMAHWRDGANPFAGAYPGVGDERALDLITLTYAALDHTLPLKVEVQSTRMFDCLSASWASVIRALGDSSAPGLYGVKGIPLNEDAPDFDPSDESAHCTDVWVDNDSIYSAWLDDIVASLVSNIQNSNSPGTADELAAIGKIVIKQSGFLDGPDASKFVDTARSEFVRLTYTLAVQRRLDELLRQSGGNKNYNPISLARGGMGAFAGRAPGNVFPVANWIEPQDLNTLPEKDEFGRDKETIFGFFSRAHADYWCEHPEIFDRLRPMGETPTDQQRDACTFLLGMMYQGTTENYRGGNAEKRTIDGKAGSKPVSSICRIGSKRGMNYSPIFLSPGYVSFDPENKTAGPYEQTNGAYRSVFNWCRAIPVLSYKKGNEQNDDLIAIAKPGASLDLRGEDLGDAPGSVEFFSYLSGGPAKVAFSLTPESWRERALTLALPKNLSAGEFCLRVRRADGVKSEGRFVLRIENAKDGKVPGAVELSIGDSDAVAAEFYGETASLPILPHGVLTCPSAG